MLIPPKYFLTPKISQLLCSIKASTLLIVSLILLSIIIPKFLIDENVDAFNGEEAAYARYALYHASRLAIDDSLYQLIVIKSRVIQIDKVSDVKQRCGIDPVGNEKAIIYGDYKAVVRQYTFFGIPLKDYLIHCENSEKYGI